MPGYLRQSTATQARALGPFLDDTDFKTPETGLTILASDIKLVKNGAASVNKNSGGGTHRINGNYSVTFDATDTNTVGELEVSCDVAGALIVFDKFTVLEEAAFDLLWDSGADTLVTLAAVTHTGAVVPTVTTTTTATNLTNLPSIPANWITAAGINANAITAAKINAAALDGKGDWNIGKTGYSLTQTFPTNFADLAITATSGRTTVGTINTDAITAAALAADAVDEIRDGLLPTQNTAFNNIPFLFVAASDHVTPVTGATGMAVTRSIDGGSFGAGTGTGPAEISSGMYQYDASAADMNGGVIVFRFTATGGTPGAPDDVFLTMVTGGGV